MHAERTGPELIVWAGPTRCELIGRLLDVMGAEVGPIGVGGARSKRVSDLAASLECPYEDDLRKLIVEHPAAFLLLGEHEDTSAEDLKTAVGAGTMILTLDPAAGDFDTLDQLEPILGSLHLLPAFSQSPGALASANPGEALDERRVVGFDSAGRSASLYARLWDAWATVLGYLPSPESIDAALTVPLSGGGAGTGVPEQLNQLAGRLTAHGRIGTSGSVVLELADATGTEHRGLHVVSDSVELRVTDGGYELRQNDGEMLDSSQARETMTWMDLIAHQWRRLLDRAASPGGAIQRSARSDKSVLACCLATLLSARTGQPERPADLLRMHV